MQQAAERVAKVRQEQKALMDARNKHEKRCVACPTIFSKPNSPRVTSASLALRRTPVSAPWGT